MVQFRFLLQRIRELISRLVWRSWKSIGEDVQFLDIPSHAANVQCDHDSDGINLTVVGSRRVLRLDQTAYLLWQLCDGERSVKDIVALLEWRFQDDSGRVQDDVINCFQRFATSGLLSISRRKKPGAGKAISSPKPPVLHSPDQRPRVYAIGCPFEPDWSSNSDRRPLNFDWTERREDATIPLTVCIDLGIQEALEAPGRKIAWLLESPAISQLQGLYEFIPDNLERLIEAYQVILSSDRELCAEFPPIQYHPAGSNLPWIAEADYRIYPKSKLCSMFASGKQMVEGHRVRHEYALRFKGKVDLFGGACGSPRLGGSEAHPDKREGLLPYMFSITMENCRKPLYYSEKLTDCFATGTVPVYWGSNAISEIFDMRGVIVLDDEFQLSALSSDLYYEMMPFIERNLEIVAALEGADDLLFAEFIQP